jgi:hypothetical protein
MKATLESLDFHLLNPFPIFIQNYEQAMKKVYLLAGALVTGFAASAQFTQAVPAKNSREVSFTKKKANPVAAAKAEGDTLWFNDFSTPSDWTISNLGSGGTPPHTAGDWAIVNAMPASLVSQVPTYNFPAAMNSASGGNFALIDSDAQGGTATQNALLTTSTGIDLSGAGNAALYLRFTEIYRHYYDENYVQVSNDGGATWMEFQVNPVSEVPVNTNSADPEIEVVNITAASGGAWGSDVRIRFRYVGAWDWFWGIDDVMIVEAWENDVKINNWYQSTEVGTQELDYYIVNQAQSSFPGLTFGAIVENNGAATQSDIALHVTAPSASYDETGATVATPLASGDSDSISVDVPLMIPTAVGDYEVTVTTTMGNMDSDASNNVATFSVRRDQWWYSRDDGQLDGAISQVSSQTDAALKIGNVMEIFDPMDISFVQMRLVNQATAVGQQIFSEIWVLGADDFEFMAETQPYTIQNGDLNNFVTLPLDGGVLSVSAGDVILVVAGHYGGANEVAFGLAQPTFAGTVLGFTANGESFQLTDPNAVMIRVSNHDLAVDENEAQFGVNVFPNPAADETTVSFELPNAADVTVTVTDLSGKVVYTNTMANTTAGKHNVAINTAELAGGVYAVNFNANNTIVTKKLVVKK